MSPTPDPARTVATTGATPSSSVVGDLGSVLLLTAAWAGMAIQVDPRGEFSLNDDWAYALPVKALTEQGLICFTFWQSMTLIGQVLWGSVLPAWRVFVLGVAVVGADGRSCGRLRTLRAVPPYWFGHRAGDPGRTDAGAQSHLLRTVLHLHDRCPLRGASDPQHPGALRGARYGERPVSSDWFGSCLCGPVRSPTCPGGIPGLPCRFSAQARLRSPLAPLRDVPHAACGRQPGGLFPRTSPLRPASGDVLPEGQFPQ